MKYKLIIDKLLARNSHILEIMTLHSVMVELLSGVYYPNRGSIAQISCFRLYSVGCLLGAGALNKLSGIQNLTLSNMNLSSRLFSTTGRMINKRCFSNSTCLFKHNNGFNNNLNNNSIIEPGTKAKAPSNLTKLAGKKFFLFLRDIL